MKSMKCNRCGQVYVIYPVYMPTGPEYDEEPFTCTRPVNFRTSGICGGIVESYPVPPYDELIRKINEEE